MTSCQDVMKWFTVYWKYCEMYTAITTVMTLPTDARVDRIKCPQYLFEGNRMFMNLYRNDQRSFV